MAYLQEVAAAHAFTEIVPVSAKQGSNLDELLKTLQTHLPEKCTFIRRGPCHRPD